MTQLKGQSSGPGVIGTGDGIGETPSPTASEPAIPPPVRDGRPSRQPRPLADAGAFVTVAGLLPDEITGTRVVGHLDVDERHHTPWGIVHGGVYTTAVETAASLGASTAVQESGRVAVGLTNTTHFLRSITSGRVRVVATALNQGRTQQLWSVDITDGAGRLIAHGEVRLQNLTPQGD